MPCIRQEPTSYKIYISTHKILHKFLLVLNIDSSLELNLSSLSFNIIIGHFDGETLIYLFFKKKNSLTKRNVQKATDPSILAGLLNVSPLAYHVVLLVK